jgi:prepilin-type N-terminal cleavage/methylation domain-containing protein
MKNGFTILELVVVMAIIATATVALYPTLSNISSRKDFEHNIKTFQTEFANTRLNAFSRGVTTRINTSRSGDVYTITSYASNSNPTSCSTAGTWTQLNSVAVDVNANFQVTGTALGNVCFYRDGTSTGGGFTFSQKDSGTQIGAATINIYISSGFVDVSMQ